MRHFALAVAVALVACGGKNTATPDDAAIDAKSNLCGNGVVDPDEDCEHFDGEDGTCAPAGSPHECHFICSQAAGSAAVACPTDLGYGCGVDGLCRQPSGTFTEAKT